MRELMGNAALQPSLRSRPAMPSQPELIEIAAAADPAYPEGSRLPAWLELPAIEGQPPNPANLPPGCPFEPRCPYRIQECIKSPPPLLPRPDGGRFACLVDVTTTAPRQAVHETA